MSVPSLRRADAQLLHRRRAVAAVELLLPAGRARGAPARAPARDKPDRGAHVVARAGLRAEAAAHGVDDHAHAAERQAERVRELGAHAGGVLRRHVDREPVGAPVGDDGVRLHAAVRLHLGAVFAFDDDVGAREARRSTSPREPAVLGPRTLPAAASGAPAAIAAGEALPVHRALEHHAARPACARPLDVDDEGQRLVVDLIRRSAASAAAGVSAATPANVIADIEHAALRGRWQAPRTARPTVSSMTRAPRARRDAAAAGAGIDRTERACGCGERSSRACSMPGSFTSTVKRAAPVTFARPLMRGTDLPIQRARRSAASGGASSAPHLALDFAQRATPAMPNGVCLRAHRVAGHAQPLPPWRASSIASTTCG